MPRNHSNALPRYILSYDTETWREQLESDENHYQHRMRLGVAKYARIVGVTPTEPTTEVFNKPDQFWALVTRLTGPRHTLWIVAHNAVFDMVISDLKNRMTRGELVIEWPRSKRKATPAVDEDTEPSGSIVLQSPPTIIAVRDTTSNGRIVIIDSMNYFRMPLKQMGEACGLPKLPMPEFGETDAKWIEYCERDAEIVFATFTELIRWIKEGNYGLFRYTGAAQSMAAFRHRFMVHPIYVHDNAEIKTLERNGYFGGRTEVFRMGEIDETVHHLDVNALFPSVMQNNEFPVKLDRFEIRDEYLELAPGIEAKRSIAEVEIETREPIFPRRGLDHVTYPIGRFRTTLAGIELAYAKRKGYIKSWGSWSEYETKPIFRLWVNELWQTRMNYRMIGNKLYAEFCKLLMNSLYGKFGQLAAEWVNCPKEFAHAPFASWTHRNCITGERDEFRSVGWKAQRKLPNKQYVIKEIVIAGVTTTQVSLKCHELRTTFPAISAFVTAFARMKMNALRSQAGAMNVFYQGVDGLIVTNSGRDRLAEAGLLDDYQLGMLRLECSTDHGMIFGCSDYRLGERIVISGRPLPASIGNHQETLRRRFAGVRELFQGNLTATVSETHFEWQRSSSYRKGQVMLGGWVEPLVEPISSAPFPENSNVGNPANSANASTIGVSEDKSPPSHSSTALINT